MRMITMLMLVIGAALMTRSISARLDRWNDMMIEPCLAIVLCPEAIAEPQSAQLCQLPDGSIGVKCRRLFYDDMELLSTSFGSFSSENNNMNSLTAEINEFIKERKPYQKFSKLNLHSEFPKLHIAFKGLLTQLKAKNERIPQFGKRTFSGSKKKVRAKSPSFLFNLNSLSSPKAQLMGHLGLRQNLVILTAAKKINREKKRRYGASSRGITAQSPNTSIFQFISQIVKPMSYTNSVCKTEPRKLCRKSIYRSIDGKCNNLRNPLQGKSLTGLLRLLPNTYDDGIFSIRTLGVNGKTLPSARFVSQVLVKPMDQSDDKFTLSLMQFGQFIDHDLSHSLIFRHSDGSSIECCDGGRFPSSPKHSQCAPIKISPQDPFYRKFGIECMNFVRSMPAPQLSCKIRPSTPINEITAYLDASNVYGNEPGENKKLRSFRRGMLRTSGNNLLPKRISSAKERSCRSKKCFVAGDSRVNEQSGLALIHTIFLREHNRIVAQLHKQTPRWSDEKLFQQARRILIAEWQHIIYNEWLPNIIGFKYARDHALLPLSQHSSLFYDDSIDASILNEFSTAAFRFGHSLVVDTYKLFKADNTLDSTLNVTATFFNTNVISSKFNEHIRSFIDMAPQVFDSNVVKSLSQQLFTTNFKFGMDLIALNIQRGRDHGIPTYKSMLTACTGIKVKRWTDFEQVMSPDKVDALRRVYRSPDDVDLFPGGLLEDNALGAVVGPTFQCIIGEQFFNLRFGDRFFYDNGRMKHSFSAEQLNEIRKSSWARILCDNFDEEAGSDSTKVPPLAFLTKSLPVNRATKCSAASIPRLDLSVFKRN